MTLRDGTFDRRGQFFEHELSPLGIFTVLFLYPPLLVAQTWWLAVVLLSALGVMAHWFPKALHKTAMVFCVYVAVAILLAGICFFTGCSNSHFQVFQTNREADFSAWVETMRGGDTAEVVARIGAWQVRNMKYEIGVRDVWPGYLDAWNATTNCNGFAVVAGEALARLGFADFRLVEAGIPGGWHVVCSDARWMMSNGVVTEIDAPDWNGVALAAAHAVGSEVVTSETLRDRTGALLETLSR